MQQKILFKYVERKYLIKLNGEAFIDSKQHIDPHHLVYWEQYYLPVAKARFRDNKRTARITVENGEGVNGTVDIPVNEFYKFPVLEVTIEYDHQSKDTAPERQPQS